MRQLRAQVADKTGGEVQSETIAVHPALAELLPEGGLRPGCAYTLDEGGALLMALLAEPSGAGAWCAAVGMPELGVEAASQAGVALDRLVLVSRPGRQWLSVVAALAEVVSVVAVRPGSSVSPADAARLAARMRDREAALLVVGKWPRAEAALRVEEARWSGVGVGHGHLRQREVTLGVSCRRYPRPRRSRLLLPGPDGRLCMAAPAAVEVRRLRAVG